MEAYLEGNEPDVATLKALIRKGTLSHVVRARAVRLGVQEQGRAAAARRRCRLSAVAARHSAECRASSWTATRTTAAPPTDDAPFSALAFKIMNDPFVGTLTFARIYSGKLEAASTVLNSVKDKKRKGRPHAADACQRPRGHRGSLSPATSSRWPA